MALLDGFTTGPDSFSVPPLTTTTRFQTGSMPGGVRSTFLNNAHSPEGTEALLDVGGGNLKLTLGVDQYVRLEVVYGSQQDGVHPLGLDLRRGGADRIRTTISHLAGSLVNFNIVIFSAGGWSINGSNVGAGTVDLPFSGFTGPGGQDFTNVDYIIFIFQSLYSLTLDRIETAGSARWSAVISSGEVVAIHAVLVPTSNGDGEILLFGGDNHDHAANLRGDFRHTARFNCRNPMQGVVSVTSPNADVFCCGHAFIGDGRLLTAGGTQSFQDETPPPHEHRHFGGHRHAFVYDATTMVFTEVASMGFRPGKERGGGRWYPSLCTLMTGEVLAVGGHPAGDDDRHNNNLPERYEPLADRWVFLASTEAHDDDEPDLYPRLHALRDGAVFVSSALRRNSRCIAINPWTGDKRDVCDLPDEAYRDFASPSVLLPLTPQDDYRSRVLLCGGVTSQMADLGDASPAWAPVPRNGSTAELVRQHACATILPTGDVLMTGGDLGAGIGVMEPELYSTPLDHAIGTPSYLGGQGSWTTIPDPATVVRNYHSTALLMPDGRVWTGGGNQEIPPKTQPNNPPTQEQKKVEIYLPPYPAGDRPSITSCPRVIAYGHEFPVESPQAQEIRSVTLLRCGSSTHAFNPDQRCIFLLFTLESANRLRVTAPPDGAVAPPGHYMLFLVDNAGRPCQYASFIRVGGTMSLLPEPSDKVVLADSSDQGPALASHGGRLFLAWTGSGNPQLNLMFSDDNGATFHGKRIFDDTSPHGPALVSHAGRLLLAWTGSDDNLNVAKVVLFANTAGAFGIEGLEDKVVLQDATSGKGPALASHAGRLFLAWTGSGNPQLNAMFSDDNGATFHGKRIFDDTSPHGPALVSHVGRVLLGWAGEGDENLNVAKVRLAADAVGGFGIEGLEDKVVLDDSSGDRPTLASYGGCLFLAWTGSGNPQLNAMFSDSNGATFGGKRVFSDTSPHGPALVSHGACLLSWAGEGDGNLNVAKVTESMVPRMNEMIRTNKMIIVTDESGEIRHVAHEVEVPNELYRLARPDLRDYYLHIRKGSPAALVRRSTNETGYPIPGDTAEPATADPDATARAKATYADLLAAPSRLDYRLVIGQALRGWDFDLPIDEPVTALTDAGLPAPALLEVDLTDFGVTEGGVSHDKDIRELLHRHSTAGGLLGFSFHIGNPFTGGSVYDRHHVDLPQLDDPTDPKTPAAKRWSSELDRIADIMGSFPAAVVLFRPLHESNGDWFWWGQADPDEFQAVWQGMFSYLTATKGLHHLLWVYSANRNLGDELSDPTRLYPGDDVVDLVGLDIYDDDLANTEPGYEAMVNLGKPFGITEYGATNWPTEHNGAVKLPNNKVIQIIKRDYPQTVLATAWYSQDGNNWQISDKPHPEALLLDPWTITLAPQRRVPQRRRMPQRGRPRPKRYSREHEGPKVAGRPSHGGSERHGQ